MYRRIIQGVHVHDDIDIFLFFFNETATTEIYTLSLHDALPIYWENLSHNHEVRWPFVFVSAYLDGLQVFSLMDPDNPQTVGYYDTYVGSTDTGFNPVINGAFGVDVRNADGLIVISDMSTGFWTFRMDGFNGWNGEDWGMPNISSVQDWDEESKEGTR